MWTSEPTPEPTATTFVDHPLKTCPRGFGIYTIACGWAFTTMTSIDITGLIQKLRWINREALCCITTPLYIIRRPIVGDTSLGQTTRVVESHYMFKVLLTNELHSRDQLCCMHGCTNLRFRYGQDRQYRFPSEE